MEIDLNKIKNIHFIGIGGIGVSAIARMMLKQSESPADSGVDINVSGSDRSSSIVTEELEKLGAKIHIGDFNPNLVWAEIDLVIYTTAIPENNLELVKAKELGIPTLTYPELLGLVSKNKYTIAVSGTHGKTTTTAMVAKILVDAKKDPTVVVGSLLQEGPSNSPGQVNTNFIAGESEIFLTEACEYRRAFLNLEPKIIVITNIEEDHLDYYKDLAEIQDTFAEFVSKLGNDDYLICNPNDENLKPIISSAKCKIINYLETRFLSDVKLQVPGKYNVENAMAALAVAKVLKVGEGESIKSLEEFKGTWRRFEFKGKTSTGAIIYDDYAHHPTEIKAMLQGAREKFPDKKIVAVFQPHLYSRTKLLLDDFATSFEILNGNCSSGCGKGRSLRRSPAVSGTTGKGATLRSNHEREKNSDGISNCNTLIITDIYAAREKDTGEIHAQDLVKKIKTGSPDLKVLYFPTFEETESYLKEKTDANDIIITIGAGDVFKVGEDL